MATLGTCLLLSNVHHHHRGGAPLQAAEEHLPPRAPTAPTASLAAIQESNVASQANRSGPIGVGFADASARFVLEGAAPMSARVGLSPNQHSGAELVPVPTAMSVQGIAFDTGRLSGCTVCLDGSAVGNATPQPPDGKCQSWEPQVRTSASGEYSITEPAMVHLPNVNLIIIPGPDCIDALTFTPLRATLTCTFRNSSAGAVITGTPSGQTCSTLTDLAHRVYLLSPSDSSLVLQQLAFAFRLPEDLGGDVGSVDPTSVSAFNRVNHATLLESTALRNLEVWEEQAVSLLYPWQLHHSAHPLRGATYRDTVIASVRNWIANSILNGDPTLLPSSTTQSAASATLASTPLATPLAYRGAAAAPTNATQLLVTASPPPPPSPSPMGLSFLMPEPLGAIISAVAVNALGLDLQAIPDASDKILATGMAATRLSTSMREVMPADAPDDDDDNFFSAYTRGDTCDASAWLLAMQSLAANQQVGLWLASQTASLAAGTTDVTQYMEITSSANLASQARNTSVLLSVDLGCLDSKAATYSYTATLHRPAACVYTTSWFARMFLSMNYAQAPC